MIVDEKMLAVVRLAIQGDVQAMERLCEEKAQGVLYAALNVLKDRTDAEDAAQEVMLKLQKGIRRLQCPEYFDVWLYRIILNECSNIKRKEPKWEFPGDDFADLAMEERIEFLPQEYAEDTEKRGRLMQIIQGLKPHYKEIILMHYYEDMSYAEIAMVLDATIPKVANILKRARDRIRMELEKLEHKEAGAHRVAGLAAVPVLSQALRLDAEMIFPRESMRAWVAAGKTSGAAGGKAASAGTAGKGLSGTAAVSIVSAAAICALIMIPFLQKDDLIPSVVNGVQNVIQESETQEPAEPELEIKNVSSNLTEEEAPLVANIDFALTGTLYGSVKLKAKDGSILSGYEQYLAGLPVTVTDDAGAKIAGFFTDESGRFSFEGLTEDKKYHVSLDLDGSPFAAALAYAEDGVRPDVERDEETGEMTIYVQTRYAPDFTITFAGGACACGHINPDAAQVIYDDFPGTVFDWTVTSLGGDVVSSGEGMECGALLELQQAGAYGVYTVEWKAVDISGYESAIRRAFKVVPEPVDPRLYE